MYIKIDENNKVIMQIVDKFAEGLEIDNKTSFNVASVPAVGRDEVLYYHPKVKAFYTEKIELTETQKQAAKIVADARAKKAKAMKWLSDNDWKVNKRTLGEWTETDERWIAYLADRAKARADIDAADAVLATKAD